ncbi:MAG: hypothetical protein H6Q70_2010 [Firmicutes bacterium]|nr:hypothetical protein [Bacillota bacterium]
MSRTVNVNEEIIVVSHGEEDTGKLAMLGANGKFHKSVIPEIEDLQEQVTEEITERTEADKQLQSNIDAETSARISADQQLQGNIEAEVTARVAADQDLQNQVTAEITARLNADEVESTARVSADQNLQEQVDVLNNKNAFSNVVVNGITIQADSQEDTIELEAGTNIELTADTANEKVTIAVTGKVASAEQADSATTAESCTGNAATAAKLETARNINGVAFDGTGDITITQVNGKTIATTDQIFDQKIYIVGSGSGSDSYWRKWSNGDMEIFGYTAAVVGTVGAVSFPITLNEVKMFLPSQVGAGWANGYTLRPIDVTTTGFSYNWDAFNTEGLGKSCMIAYHVIGTVTV